MEMKMIYFGKKNKNMAKHKNKFQHLADVYDGGLDGVDVALEGRCVCVCV